MKKEDQKQNANSSIDAIVNDTMKNLKNIVETNTVLGEQTILNDGTIIIPVSKVLVGFVCGGGELNSSCKKTNNEYPFAGGSGAGYTIVPIGFLTGKKDTFNYIEIENKDMYSELLLTANKILKKIYNEEINENEK